MSKPRAGLAPKLLRIVKPQFRNRLIRMTQFALHHQFPLTDFWITLFPAFLLQLPWLDLAFFSSLLFLFRNLRTFLPGFG